MPYKIVEGENNSVRIPDRGRTLLAPRDLRALCSRRGKSILEKTTSDTR